MTTIRLVNGDAFTLFASDTDVEVTQWPDDATPMVADFDLDDYGLVRDIWDALVEAGRPAYKVLDEDGIQMAEAVCLRLEGNAHRREDDDEEWVEAGEWLYNDNMSGWEIMDSDPRTYGFDTWRRSMYEVVVSVPGPDGTTHEHRRYEDDEAYLRKMTEGSEGTYEERASRWYEERFDPEGQGIDAEKSTDQIAGELHDACGDLPGMDDEDSLAVITEAVRCYVDVRREAAENYLEDNVTCDLERCVKALLSGEKVYLWRKTINGELHASPATDEWDGEGAEHIMDPADWQEWA